ncbi:VOC family protein [Phytoactinopolyspora limicola]|uniref:VOC family protein n=1 Tax=Phytoactinopolyspora limicola TaxID=2715536 RepID=UPI00140DC116|nr:VOC family protein [Phytoactinopolyspora limicola]
MPLATFKDLVIDATDSPTLGEFYATTLGLSYIPHDDGDGHLKGPATTHTVWINRVPEPKTVKHRVHLDVHTTSLDELTARGARPVEEHEHWTVLADPEGGEFCAFVRDKVDDYRLYEVIVDSTDPTAIAHWWADVVGGTLGHTPDERAWWIEPMPNAPFDRFVFVPVPEPKIVKNRIHWDVSTDDLETLIQRGATMVRPKDDDIGWHVLADPEGNEFCAFTS